MGRKKKNKELVKQEQTKEEEKKEPESKILGIVNPAVKFLKRGVKGAVIIEDLGEDENRALLLAGNGVFEYFANAFGEIIRPIPKGRYPEIKESLKLTIEKLPEDMFLRAISFLREVKKKYSAEGCICYFYNTESKEYVEFVPKQTVSGASVDYKVPDEVHLAFKNNGFIIAGTIHSHPSFNAFQSGTDHGDEKGIDGWHITLGYLERPAPEVHCRWSFRGTMFDAELEDMVEFPEEKVVPHPEDWINNVSKKVYTAAGYNSGWQRGYGRSSQRGVVEYGCSMDQNDAMNEWFGRTGYDKDNPIYESDETIFLFAGDQVEEMECTVTSD